ncbi:hypothetical protein [Sulfitobacter albidus]|uniref:hypothetical protein n=1 Tax=Sulfitobacter albidus TaxID=2829501 RepID=UPI0020C8F24D|nr:hypothetical protein [Sulfitobacter albidus]
MTRFMISPTVPVMGMALLLSACGNIGLFQPEDTVTAPPPEAEVSAQEVAEVAPDPELTAAPPPPPAAKTQEALDTTSAAQRAAAAAPAAPEETSKLLGTTVASLGSPTEPGFWLKTPLVKTETKGRVTNKANGKSSAVTLIPIDGPATGGSRMSLPAMRLIEASLTDLTEVEVTLEG